jgi:hypothetical protein
VTWPTLENQCIIIKYKIYVKGQLTTIKEMKEISK